MVTILYTATFLGGHWPFSWWRSFWNWGRRIIGVLHQPMFLAFLFEITKGFEANSWAKFLTSWKTLKNQIPGLGGQFGQPPLCLLTLLLQLLICSPCDGSTRFFSHVSDRFRDHIESYSVAASSPFCRKKGAQNEDNEVEWPRTWRQRLDTPWRQRDLLDGIHLHARVRMGSEKACHGTGRG